MRRRYGDVASFVADDQAALLIMPECLIADVD